LCETLLRIDDAIKAGELALDPSLARDPKRALVKVFEEKKKPKRRSNLGALAAKIGITARRMPLLPARKNELKIIMRRLNTPPYCRLETTIPVRYKTYDKRMRLVTVRAIYKFDSFWHLAHDLRQLLTESREELTSRLGLGKVDLKKGTVGGVPVRMVPTTTYPEDHLTAAELKAPEGYRYWKVLPDGKTVRLLSIWDHEQEHVDKRDRLGRKIANDERYLKPVEVPLPQGWKVVQPFPGSCRIGIKEQLSRPSRPKPSCPATLTAARHLKSRYCSDGPARRSWSRWSLSGGRLPARTPNTGRSQAPSSSTRKEFCTACCITIHRYTAS
jgi:hypothetical protein